MTWFKVFGSATVSAFLLYGCATQQQTTDTLPSTEPEPPSDLSEPIPEQSNIVSPPRQALKQILGARIFEVNEHSIPPYRRSDYMSSWLDADRDCQNTRQEVLIAESIEPVTFDEVGCTVKAGRWLDPYTNQYFTDPKQLDIDHVVPLKEAHLSGAFTWVRDRKRAYANDLENPHALIAVQAGANRAKGDKDPARWLPSNADFLCSYVSMWVAVKTFNDLAYDEDELTGIKGISVGCE